MLQPSDSQKSQFPSNLPLKTANASVEQATIGGSVVIKGEVSGSESLYIDGRIEGTVNFADNRVTIARNGSVATNISAGEVVILGKVQGNIQCSDRLEIRSEGSLTGDVVTQRISVEDGAILKGLKYLAGPQGNLMEEGRGILGGGGRAELWAPPDIGSA